uniref:Uncharacterized protein n=1 Tax=Arundo donax TaxID=35708 RepID=A0A0A9EER5_ARUDO
MDQWHCYTVCWCNSSIEFLVIICDVVLPLLSVARHQKMYVQAKAVSSVVKNTDTTLTPLLSSMFIPEILVTVGPSTPTTFLRTLQYPPYLIVAPKNESIRLPHRPAAVAKGITSSCLQSTSEAH